MTPDRRSGVSVKDSNEGRNFGDFCHAFLGFRVKEGGFGCA